MTQTEGGLPPAARSKGWNECLDTAPGLTAGGDVRFYVGLHHPTDAKHFDRACITINQLMTRRKPTECDDVFVDSAGFVTIDLHGGYPEPPEAYAGHLCRLDTKGVVRITVAASQDYMCEPHMLAKTGLSVADHQRLTIERYDAILAELNRLYDGPPPFHLLPVLQGWTKADYVSHLRQYGERLTPGMWVGVGSVCKRQASVAAIEDILTAIKGARPDLRLHGFGVKVTSLRSHAVRRMLYSADSMAWSYAAAKVAARMTGVLMRRFQRTKIKPRVARRYYRRVGKHMPDANDWREAKAFLEKVVAPLTEPEQPMLFAA